MNIAAYCRVSTGKEDQLNSLEVQKQYFQDYAERNHHRLVHLYADEGISGTKISKREQFKQMLDDAERGCFDLVVVKDISRFARNTVDLLESVRKLKRLGIEVQFLTANMTSMGDSEFVLTMMGALAQEESANTSKRVKFGKKVNAEKGRVPNLVYGYDKINGEYFTMDINQEEAAVIRQIFRWYIDEGYGGSKIASMLNQQGFRTKRGCNWTQNSVCGILNNESKLDVISWDEETILMAYNDTPETDWHERSPLTLAYSRDEGLTWQNLITLAPAPGNKCQPAMCRDAKGRLNVIYMHRHTAIEHLVLEITD